MDPHGANTDGRSGHSGSSSSGEPADTSRESNCDSDEMLCDGRPTLDSSSYLFNNRGEGKSDAAQSASSGEPADETTQLRVKSRATDVTGGVITVSSLLADDEPDPEAQVSWTWEDLIEAQKVDKEIGPILEWFSQGPDQPPWETVALHSAETKALWNMWLRLSIRDGVLKRRFEEIDGLNNS
jgi:hypothetical protein